MKYFIVLSMALTLVACKSQYNGNLELNQDLSFAQKKGKVSYLKAGFHQATVTGSKKSITIKVNSEKIKLKVAKKSRGKIRQSSFELLPAETGQSFIISGHKDSKTEVGQKQHGKESCSYTIHEHKCVLKTVKKKGPNGKVVKKKVKKCGKFPTTKFGVKKVAYHYVETTYYLDIELTDAQDKTTILGTFDGSTYDSDKVYDFTGKCHKKRSL